jgi:predicted Mrr-cat superfamily restriction endonuclease
MTMPQIHIHDCITGETILRDMNETELANYKALQAAEKKLAVDKTKADADKQAARQAVLDKLGLTADEIAALLS